MRIKVIPIIVLVIVAGVLGILINGMSGKASANPGDEAIDFQLRDIDGKEYQLSERKGKVVVLNFFATWCQPCIDEAPELEAFGAEETNASLPIIYNGVKPDNFSDDVIVIVEGFIRDNGVFEAEKVQTKCPSKYEGEDTENYDMECI